jgi:hypothetical protein
MRYETVKAVTSGGICGAIWQRGVGTCGIPHTFDVRRRIDRLGPRITFRKILLLELMEHGGDFQSARFTADTELHIERRCHAAPGAGNWTHTYTTRTKIIPIAKLRDCADLVDSEFCSWDFGSEGSTRAGGARRRPRIG